MTVMLVCADVLCHRYAVQPEKWVGARVSVGFTHGYCCEQRYALAFPDRVAVKPP